MAGKRKRGLVGYCPQKRKVEEYVVENTVEHDLEDETCHIQGQNHTVESSESWRPRSTPSYQSSNDEDADDLPELRRCDRGLRSEGRVADCVNSVELDSESIVPPSVTENDETGGLPNQPGLTPVAADEQLVRSAKPGKSKQHYDKVNACVFCSKTIKQKIQRHLLMKHTDEPEVMAFVSERGEKRRNAVYALMCRGNHNYNKKLLNGDMPGELIVLKRPHSDTPASRFAPCHACLGYVLKDDLWRHIHQCPCASERERQMDNRTLKVLSGGLNGPDDTAESVDDSDFYKTVMAQMKLDDVRDAIIRDPLLLKLGKSVMINKGKDQNHVSTIRSLLRVLGKLVLCMQRKGGHRHTLETILQPRYFDAIISCVQEVCEWEIGDANHPPKYKIPSRALKLGHGLKQAAGLALSSSIKEGDRLKRQELTDYLTLHTGEWGGRISHAAISTLDLNKPNSIDPLPVTEDLVLLLAETKKKMHGLTHSLCLGTSGPSEMKIMYYQLVKLTCAAVTLFNKRRGDEVSRLLVETYQRRKKSVLNQEIVSRLSPLEQELAKTMDLVEIVGQRKRRVPVLLTPVMTKAMNVLIQVRSSRGVYLDVTKANPYLFAKARSRQNVSGRTAMKYACQDLGLKKPELITSTKLRKYLATVTQLMNLDNNQLGWLCNHLGHHLQVHRQFYRLPHEVLQVCKISQLLLASEKGQVHRYANKTLDEIDVDELIRHMA